MTEPYEILLHPPSPEAPRMRGEEGERRVLLRSRADKATAKQNMASERFRPTGVQEGATGMPVGLHPQARRELGKVPREVFSKIDTAIWGLGENPRPLGVKKLEGDLHRIRIGNWRVIYAILDEEHRVVILRIARRTERTYKGLR